MESILTTIKKLLGITKEYTHFDVDITVLINTYLVTLNQLGVGPEKPAVITGDLETWFGIFGEIEELEAVKSYLYFKVKLAFDPPSQSSLLEAIKRSVDELEWRLTNHTVKEG